MISSRFNHEIVIVRGLLSNLFTTDHTCRQTLGMTPLLNRFKYCEIISILKITKGSRLSGYAKKELDWSKIVILDLKQDPYLKEFESVIGYEVIKWAIFEVIKKVTLLFRR